MFEEKEFPDLKKLSFKELYKELVFQRRYFHVLNQVDAEPLPKGLYLRRKRKGVNKKRVGFKKFIKIGDISNRVTDKNSKSNHYRQMTFEAYMYLNAVEREFAKRLKDMEKKKKGSIKNLVKANTPNDKTRKALATDKKTVDKPKST